MTKTKLQFDYDFDFCLIGIVSSEKDYRLCWMLNNLFNIKLAKAEEHSTAQSNHSMYSYVQEELFREYYLIANKSDSHVLIEELKNMDYFLMIKGVNEEEEKKNIADLIKKSDMVSGAYVIDVHSLKSKHNFVL
jgi:hypothetical protein